MVILIILVVIRIMLIISIIRIVQIIQFMLIFMLMSQTRVPSMINSMLSVEFMSLSTLAQICPDFHSCSGSSVWVSIARTQQMTTFMLNWNTSVTPSLVGLIWMVWWIAVTSLLCISYHNATTFMAMCVAVSALSNFVTTAWSLCLTGLYIASVWLRD